VGVAGGLAQVPSPVARSAGEAIVGHQAAESDAVTPLAVTVPPAAFWTDHPVGDGVPGDTRSGSRGATKVIELSVATPGGWPEGRTESTLPLSEALPVCPVPPGLSRPPASLAMENEPQRVPYSPTDRSNLPPDNDKAQARRGASSSHCVDPPDPALKASFPSGLDRPPLPPPTPGFFSALANPGSAIWTQSQQPKASAEGRHGIDRVRSFRDDKKMGTPYPRFPPGARPMPHELRQHHPMTLLDSKAQFVSSQVGSRDILLRVTGLGAGRGRRTTDHGRWTRRKSPALTRSRSFIPWRSRPDSPVTMATSTISVLR